MLFRDLPDARSLQVYGRQMSDDEIDPGGNTEMFRAFVTGAEHYKERTSGRGPVLVMVAALAVALLMFVVIVAHG